MYAQVDEHFDDGDFSSAPVWEGDTGDFIVNSSLSLQLHADAAGSSILQTGFIQADLSDMEWRFHITLNFSPSSSNYARVYLVSDQPGIGGPVNGYFLQFGESLSNDAIELFRQDGNNTVSVCRGPDGMIASSFEMNIKVTRDNIGLWNVYADTGNVQQFTLLASGAEGMYNVSNFFGIRCNYTSGNIQGFFFDDIYAGPQTADTIAPTLISIVPLNDSVLELTFSENIDPVSGLYPLHYRIDSTSQHPASVWQSGPDLSKVLLWIQPHLPYGDTSRVFVSDVSDLSGNIILPDSYLSFMYFPYLIPAVYDVVFNEIMFEPSSNSGLPNAEYVELANRSDKALSLEGWTLSDGTSTAVFPRYYVRSGSLLLLYSTGNSNLFTGYGEGTGLNSFPTLNNDIGDRLELRDRDGNLIDRIAFSDETYHDENKNDGGWSVERTDTSFVCPDPLNWKASIHPNGGTPGIPNSVEGHFNDEAPPYMVRAAITGTQQVTVTWSEDMSLVSIPGPTSYYITDSSGNVFYPDSVLPGASSDEMILCVPFVPGNGVYELDAESITDCPGNPLSRPIVIKFAIPQEAVPGDIQINEILSNPYSGESDFIEIKNASGKIIDLKNWRIAESPYLAPEQISSTDEITTKSLLLFPGGIIALSENPDELPPVYPESNIYGLFKVDEMPDFNADDGTVSIFDSTGTLSDRLQYTASMHLAWLNETAGVSLERLSSRLATNVAENWHSAASTSGWATPGSENSKQMDSIQETTFMSLEPDVFSPDNDGMNDILLLTFHGIDPGNVGRVQVYDLNGMLVRNLLESAAFGTDAVVIWDGMDEKRLLVRPGIYIVYAIVVSADGITRSEKQACAVYYK